jgi:hypothetical protein
MKYGADVWGTDPNFWHAKGRPVSRSQNGVTTAVSTTIHIFPTKWGVSEPKKLRVSQRPMGPDPTSQATAFWSLPYSAPKSWIYIYIHDIYIYNKCNHMPTVTYNSYITLTLPMDSYWNMYGQQGQHTCKSSIGLAYLTAKPGYRDRWKIVLPVARDCAQKCRNLWYETIRNHPCQTMFDGCFMSTQTQIPSLFMISRIMFAMNIAI